MLDTQHISLILRKPRAAVGQPIRDGSGDVWRRALPRVAADRLGLELSLTRCEESQVKLPGPVAIEDDAMLLAIETSRGLAGIAIVDTVLRTALVEMQTTGTVATSRIEPRAPTAVDAALVRHVLDDWLAAFSDAQGEEVPPSIGRAYPDLRHALLKLEEGDYRETRLVLDLGGGKRTGVLRLLKLVAEARKAPADDDAMKTTVMPAEASMQAVLCRLRIPLGKMMDLSPGVLLPLDGISLRRITLEAPLGRRVADAHLGQSGGKRAVRILSADLPDEAEVIDAPAPRAAPPRPDRPMAASPLSMKPPSMPHLPGPVNFDPTGAFSAGSGALPGLPDLPGLPPLG